MRRIGENGRKKEKWFRLADNLTEQWVKELQHTISKSTQSTDNLKLQQDDIKLECKIRVTTSMAKNAMIIRSETWYIRMK